MPLLKYLQEVFHLRKRGLEAFRVMPFVQLCILNLLGISCCWDCLFCVAEVHVCVYLCVHGDLFLSHTLACKTLHTQKHTLGAVSSISAVKPDPPRLFSLVIMSKFAQEGRGKGRAMWTCVGVFCFFFFGFFGFSYKTRFWLPPISDARDPNHLLKPFKLSNVELEKHFPLCPFFQLKVKICSGKEEGCLCQITST